MKKKELSFFRFLAASIIVIFHYGQDATGLSGIMTAGPEMVTFFFVLSGFVMGITYLEKEIDIKEYWWKRIARILPIYLVALFLVIAAFIAIGYKIDRIQFVLNLLLIQSWVPRYALTLNGPGWALSVQVFFYFLFPLIVIFTQKKSVSATQMFIYSFVLWGVTQTITTIALTHGYYKGIGSLSHDLIFYFPVIHLCSFLIGIAGGKLILEKKNLSVNHVISNIAVVVSCLIIVFVINNQWMISDYLGVTFAYSSSFYAPLFIFFILSLAICNSNLTSIFNVKLFVFLGEISYSLYILQKPVHAVYLTYVTNFLNLPELYDFIVFFIFLLISSMLAYLIIERPLNMFLRNSIPRFIKLKFNHSI